MSSVSSVARSGLQFASSILEASALNVANLQTDGYRALRVQGVTTDAGGVRAVATRPDVPGVTVADSLTGAARELSNVRLEDEVISQVVSSFIYAANARVLQAEDEAVGTLLNRTA
jgi:flagellar basal-body rod protein FlgC